MRPFQHPPTVVAASNDEIDFLSFLLSDINSPQITRLGIEEKPSKVSEAHGINF